MNPEKINQTLQQHIPETACPYCFALWQNTPFELKLTRSRQTKVGDFTSRKNIAHPRITLNRDLNPFLFLVTYIHEVAHLHVFLRFGNRVDPHGEEWKNAFKQLMSPVLRQEVFPERILPELMRHMANPKASSFADADLTRVLRSFDKNASQYTALSDIPEGSIFHFQGRYFKKGKLKRTRVLCHEVKTKRNYLVPAEVLVSNIQLSLL
jgi:predicted SprT family Zn-dependent metalloprotease